MIVIVEGVDRVGKTTLCNQLGIPFYKKERELGNDDANERAQVINYGNALGHVDFWSNPICKDLNFVVDRFQWTETVYNILLRDTLFNTTIKYCVNIDYRLSKMPNVLMVLVRPTDIEESSKQHGSDLSQYSRLFDSLYKEYKGTKTWIDYNNIPEAVKYIKGLMNNEEQTINSVLHNRPL